jgi:phosphatidylethanolamine N-methyltransferase
MNEQGAYYLMDNFVFKFLAVAFGMFGGAMVGGAYLRLGITGTYLGDYFGILMKERVTGFPFNVMDNPMYMGSTILFLAHALWLFTNDKVFLTFIG